MIVTMSTGEYLSWLHHFLKSLEGYNFGATRVYLINVQASKKQILQEKFKWVNFVDYSGKFKPKGKYDVKGTRKRVTYLKGKFMRESIEETKEPAIWIDATSVVRGELTEVFEILKTKDYALVKRLETDPKKKYAAGFFGISDLNSAKVYEFYCNKSDEWYSDQLALNQLEGKIFNLDLDTYCSFNYGKDSIIWADRGRHGKGMMDLEDYEFTENKFIEDIYARHQDYKEEFAEFSTKISKQRILLFIDDWDWVYFTTANDIANRLKDVFDFTIITKADSQAKEIKEWQGDLVWARCKSRRAQVLLRMRPDLAKKTFSTITTGGELLQSRIDEQFLSNRAEAGLFVQNDDALTRAKCEINNRKREHEVWKLSNGVDIKKFRPCDQPTGKNKEFTLGFAARTIGSADYQKGYTHLVVRACEILGIKLKTCSNRKTESLKHDEMPAFYNSIDVLIQPSTAEGCSNTLMEAMACGVPCIACNVGYHGEEAIDMDQIVFCKRDLNDVIEKIKLLRDDDKLRKEIGENARKFAESRSWDLVVENYKRVFLEAIKYSRETSGQERGVDNKDYVVIYKGQKRGIANHYGEFLRGVKTPITADGQAYLKKSFAHDFEFL